MFAKYKVALALYKIYNEKILVDEWVRLNFNQYYTSSQALFMVNNDYQKTLKWIHCVIDSMVKLT